MPEELQGDEVYLTAAQAIPYVGWVASAVKVVIDMMNFGKESAVDKAIRQLQERVAVLEQYVVQLDQRLSELEVRVSQNENRDRLRFLKTQQLLLFAAARRLASHPEDAVDVASDCRDILVALYEDGDLWMWSDIVEKPASTGPTWRQAAPWFKGVPLPVFAIGAGLWALAAMTAVIRGTAREAFAEDANRLLTMVSTRPDWVDYQTPPVSLAERFRAAVGVQIHISSTYVNAAGYCEYSFVVVNELDRTRVLLRNADMYFGQSPSTICTADPRIAAGDEAQVEDDLPQLQVLAVLEEAIRSIRDHGSLAQQYIGTFPDWTMHRLDLFAVDGLGELRRFEIEARTDLAETPVVRQVGDVVGVGWQSAEDLLTTYSNVVYVVRPRGQIDWYREDDVSRGSGGWQGPVTVRKGSEIFLPRFSERLINGGGGDVYVETTSSRQVQIRRSLGLIRHGDVANGTGTFGDPTPVANEWPAYERVFGGGQGVVYGIDASGDLYWQRHAAWPNAAAGMTPRVRIGNGWNMFAEVFAIGAGFLCGVQPNGTMLIYWFRQWQHGLEADEAPLWAGPVTVPGTGWRAFTRFSPSIGDAPVIVH